MELVKRVQIICFVFVIFLTFFIANKKAYQALDVSITINNFNENLDSNKIRVFNNKSLSVYNDYKILHKEYKFKILDQKVWGVCLPNDLNVRELFLNNVKMTLNSSLHSGCNLISPIKEYNKDVFKSAVYLSCLFVSIIIGVLFFFYFDLVSNGVRYLSKIDFHIQRKEKFFLVNIILSFVFIILWTYFSFPLLFDSDFLNVLMGVKIYKVSDWFGYINDVLIMGISRLSANVRVFTYISVATVFLLQTYLLKFIYLRLKNPWWMCFYSLLLLLPSFGGYINFMTRDLVVIYGNLFLAFYIMNRFWKRGFKSKRTFVKLDFFAVFIAMALSEIRREEIIVSLFFLLILLMLVKGSIKQNSIVILSFFTLKAMSIMLGSVYVHYSDTDRKILVTASHYVGNFIVNNYKSNNYKKDKKILSKYFNLEIIKKYHSEHGAEPTYRGGIKDKRPSNGQGELYRLLLKMSLDNPWLTLKGRLKMLFHNFGPSSKTSYYPFSSGVYPQHNEINILNLNYLYKKQYQAFRKIGLKIVGFARYSWLRYLVYGGTFSIIILAFLIILYKKFGVVSFASLIIFSRVPIFFVMSPAAQFKYIADIYIFGVMVLPIAIAYLKKNKLGS